jgi:hypothetical protein
VFVSATQRIHEAAARGALHEVQALVGSDPSLIHAADDESPWSTPLHWAAQSGSTAVVRLLLARGAARQVRDQDGKTPLDLAAARGHEGVVALLGGEGA